MLGKALLYDRDNARLNRNMAIVEAKLRATGVCLCAFNCLFISISSKDPLAEPELEAPRSLSPSAQHQPDAIVAAEESALGKESAGLAQQLAAPSLNLSTEDRLAFKQRALASASLPLDEVIQQSKRP